MQLIGEIKVHQSLQHPNIVRYQECFEDKSNVYIILELCENKVSDNRTKSDNRVCWIC